ncbi:hypothetical protein [Nonomuraea ceibae]|uniref:hypothetical protein n=1 Tax=Nonomuraea ceibae TaxID=1935170 RepID=UPI001C5E59BC|nr:hypothetical protein [Nonomuraea ceibae]
MTTYTVKPVWARFKKRGDGLLKRYGWYGDTHILVKVTAGPHWADLDELLWSFVTGHACLMRGEYLVLDKAQMEPLINAFDSVGRVGRLEFRLLPERKA